MKKIIVTLILILMLMLSGCGITPSTSKKVTAVTTSSINSDKYYFLKYYVGFANIDNQVILLSGDLKEVNTNDLDLYIPYNQSVYKKNDLIIVSSRKTGEYALYRLGKGVISHWYKNICSNGKGYIAQTSDSIIFINEKVEKTNTIKFNEEVGVFGEDILLTNDGKLVISNGDINSHTIIYIYD